MKKRVLSALLAASMMLTMAPIPSLAVGPEAKEITLGTAGVSGYANGYDYVYYGDYEGDPVKWRVLDTTSNDGRTPALFLLSEEGLEVRTFGSTDVWAQSDIRTYLQGDFYNNTFSEPEQQAILATTTQGDKDVGNYAKGCDLHADTIFLLSADEVTTAAYGFATSLDTEDSNRVDPGDKFDSPYVPDWWLRSRSETSASVGMGLSLVAVVTGDGDINDMGMGSDLDNIVRPAFNLDADDVLFTSPAQGGKTADGLTAVADTAPEEHKVTLLDSSRAFQVTEGTATAKAGETVTLTYTGAQTGGQEYISAMLTDANGTVLYYGHIQQPQAAAGTVQITLPARLEDGQYRLKVFNEQCNGDYQTDYASVFSDVTLTVRGDGAFVVDGISYQTLDEAAAAANGGTIEVVGSFVPEEADREAL